MKAVRIASAWDSTHPPLVLCFACSWGVIVLGARDWWFQIVFSHDLTWLSIALLFDIHVDKGRPWLCYFGIEINLEHMHVANNAASLLPECQRRAKGRGGIRRTRTTGGRVCIRPPPQVHKFDTAEIHDHLTSRPLDVRGSKRVKPH